jgi:TolA-binding protein
MSENNFKHSGYKSLVHLLKQVTSPVKTDIEWQMLENDMFARLDEETAPQRRRRSFLFSFGLPRSGIAWATAAALVLSIAGAGVFISMKNTGSGQSMAGIASVRGSISVTWAGKGPAQTLSSLQSNAAIKTVENGTVIATSGNGSAIVRLDKGSFLELFPGSRMEIRESDNKNLVCMLLSGSVLAKVSKREPGRRFEIQTPCAVCRVVGTVFKVDAEGGSKTTLSVFQGKVKLTPAHGVKGRESYVETGHLLTVGSTIEPFARRLAGSAAPLQNISVLSMLSDGNIPGNGLLNITSKPEGAKVLINGLLAGTTPLLIKEKTGTHSVTLYADGFKPWEATVVLGSDLVTDVHAGLVQSVCVPRRAPAARHSAGPIDRREQCEAELRLMPDYIEALVDMSSGEYQLALGIFDSLWNSGMVDIKGRTCLMDKVTACWSKLGDFEKAESALEDHYQKAETPQEKGQVLWQLATMRANCLGDFQGAEMALVEFLILQPNALWAHDAYSKLAEIQYYLGKYKSAAETYTKHITTFPDDPCIDRSMYNLGTIIGGDLNNYEKAARWYSRLIDSFHASKYRAAAFFRRGECYLRTGKTEEAMKDFKKYLAVSPQGIWRDACISIINNKKEL